LHGYKWFTSATDADVAITLARVVADDGSVGKGGAGLTCFFVKVNDDDDDAGDNDDDDEEGGGGDGGNRGGVTNKARHGFNNGLSVPRLKAKLGTKQLPTSELRLDGTTAVRIGAEGRGVATIVQLVNITRLHNAVSACSLMRCMLALCRNYAQKRHVFGTPLAANHLHVATLHGMSLVHTAALHLTFDAVALLGLAEQAELASPSSVSLASTTSSSTSSASSCSFSFGHDHNPQTAAVLLRLLTPLTKAYTARQAVALISEGVEAFGGAGYLVRLAAIFD
jgi:alkylation response protein AidB-like acyl-CoA dehydrogenase